MEVGAPENRIKVRLRRNALTPRDETSYPVFGLRANLLRRFIIEE